MKKTAFFAMMALFAATAHAAVPEILTYRGQLFRTGGFAEGGENLALTFKIYDSMSPDVVLWGRTVVAAVDKDGVFYAELKDDNGSAVQGAAHTALVDAVAAAKGAIEIGLTPPGAGEISPRQTLTTGVRAARAARTKAVDVLYAENRVMAGQVAIDEMVVHIKETFKKTNPDLASDIIKNGILLTGGGGLLSGLDRYLTQELEIPVWVSETALTNVVMGCLKVLESPTTLKQTLVRTK